MHKLLILKSAKRPKKAPVPTFGYILGTVNFSPISEQIANFVRAFSHHDVNRRYAFSGYQRCEAGKICFWPLIAP